MMEYSQNSSIDYVNHIRWNEANISTKRPPDNYNTIINNGPAYTGCNLDIARHFCAKDLCALDYDIPDEYLHQCLKTDYLLPQDNSFSTDDGKHISLSSKINEIMPVPDNSPRKVENEYKSDDLDLKSFLLDDFQHSTSTIQDTVDYKLIDQSLSMNEINQNSCFRDVEINTRNEQKLLSQAFQVDSTSQKRYPFTEISNMINKNQFSSETAGTFGKLQHFTNFNCKIDELNTEMKSVNCPNKMATLKKRKPRTMLTASQLFFLNKVFAKNHYLTSEMGKILSKRLDIPEVCLKTWFQNKRARFKRRNLNHRNSSNLCEGSGSFQTQNFN